MTTTTCDAGDYDDVDGPVPPQIRPEHKQKLAVIYLRQSSADQVLHHTGSADAQRALAEQPRRWGWPPSLIITIADDLGVSATTSSHLRSGFQRLLEMMERDEVGIVLAREVSRLARDPLDAERFLKSAIRRSVLVEVNGRVYDPTNGDLAELFGLRIQALLAWWENQHRVMTFKAAKVAKIRRGYAVSRPPIGYVESVKGVWIKDPEAAIRDAVRRIFDLYLKLRSTYKVACWLRDRSLLFPRRIRGDVRWRLVGSLGVLRVLTNPNYTADYTFRRRRLVPKEEPGQARLVRNPRREWIVARDHHDAYVTREEWDAIQDLLHGQGRGPGRRPAAGPGAGLLQGLVACGGCNGRVMRTLHDLHENPPPRGRAQRYVCVRRDEFRALKHWTSCSAALLDHEVTQRVLAELEPVSLPAALEAIQRECNSAEGLDASYRRELRRAEEEGLQLRRELRNTDPTHPRLRIALEAEVEQALSRVHDLQSEIARRKADQRVALTGADAAELMRLSEKLSDLWAGATNEERKHLIRMAITRVTVHPPTDEVVNVEIHWVSGLKERCPPLLKPKGVTRLMVDLRKAGIGTGEIAAKLKAAGITTERGRPFSRKTVQHILWDHGLNTKEDRIKALLLIRSLLIERRSRREILEALCTQGPRPKEGKWTPERLGNAITSLKRNLWPGEVPPLPGGVATLRRLAPETIEIIRQGRAAGRTFKAIAADLNARGFRPPRAAAFTMMVLYQLYQHLRTDGVLDDPAPSQTSPTDGGPERGSGADGPSGAAAHDGDAPSDPPLPTDGLAV